ncbi:hypothetical protein DICVIV_01543 [Dictyocaulus viviparus]|uniref:C2H2-type domain-containing protein n=1 Tax=Dictyocaulus viviparus TaxID=29172 RepID=A0A0D8Y673_DICVI|nr:hypothetical protein DICVIV_01543 [Dictyocaulus viviparus]
MSCKHGPVVLFVLRVLLVLIGFRLKLVSAIDEDSVRSAHLSMLPGHTTLQSTNGEIHASLIKSDVGDNLSQELATATPIRIMSTVSPARDAHQPHRLPAGVRVVRGLSAGSTMSTLRMQSHEVRTALGTGASHPGRMVSSRATSPGTLESLRTVPIRTVIGAGQGMRVMQQGGRTLIAVPSGTRLAATLSSVAARAAPVELSTSSDSGPALSVMDVNQAKSSVENHDQISENSVNANIIHGSVDSQCVQNASRSTIESAECMSSFDGSNASVSPQPDSSLDMSDSSTEQSRKSSNNGLSSRGMVTRRMARDITALPTTGNQATIRAMEYEGSSRVSVSVAPTRRRAMKRPKYSLSSGELVRAQYILPPDQLPRRSSIPREENPLSITEQARLSRRPIVVHSSGVEFAIPLSLEAHPMKLDDMAPENPREDILRDDDGVPYCYLCHSVLKTWQGYEYHIMAVHLKYRPYRCMYCMKEYFYTEEEGLSHVRSQHHGKIVTLLREYHDDKEKQLDDAFCALFLAVREGPSFTEERAAAIEKAAFMHLQKFKRMRMKVPEFATRAKMMRDFASQTFATMSSPQSMIPSMKYMTQPRHQFEHLQHHLEPLQHPQLTVPMKVVDVEHSEGQRRFVRMSDGDVAEINDRFVIEGDEEDPVGEYIEVDYVDEIIDDEVEQVQDQEEVVVERLRHDAHHNMEDGY